MAREREIDPVLTTYVKITRTKSGRKRVHVRIKATATRLDKSGTGATLEEARRKAYAGVKIRN